jgi:hypothetical protein
MLYALVQPIAHTPPHVPVTPNHPGLWVIRMCPCHFISYNKCRALVRKLVMGEAVQCGSREYMEKLCLQLLSFSLHLV